MNEILDHVFTWTGPEEEDGVKLHGFLLETMEGSIVVDPPPMSPEDEIEFKKLGIQPNWIVITSRSNVRNREWFLAQYSTPTAMNGMEAAAVGIKPEWELGFNIVMPGGLETIPMPGTGPGGVALLWREKNFLLVGDTMIGNPAGKLSPPAKNKILSPTELKVCLSALKKIPFEAFLLTHGDSILKDAKAQIDPLIELLSQGTAAPVPQAAPRPGAPEKPLIFNVRLCGVLVREGKVLMTRAKTEQGKFAGFPGSIIGLGESQRSALSRGFTDATGLIMHPVRLLHTGEEVIVAGNPPAQIFSVYWEVSTEEDLSTLEPSALFWADIKNIPLAQTSPSDIEFAKKLPDLISAG